MNSDATAASDAVERKRLREKERDGKRAEALRANLRKRRDQTKRRQSGEDESNAEQSDNEPSLIGEVTQPARPLP